MVSSPAQRCSPRVAAAAVACLRAGGRWQQLLACGSRGYYSPAPAPRSWTKSFLLAGSASGTPVANELLRADLCVCVRTWYVVVMQYRKLIGARFSSSSIQPSGATCRRRGTTTSTARTAVHRGRFVRGGRQHAGPRHGHGRGLVAERARGRRRGVGRRARPLPLPPPPRWPRALGLHRRHDMITVAALYVVQSGVTVVCSPCCRQASTLAAGHAAAPGQASTWSHRRRCHAGQESVRTAGHAATAATLGRQARWPRATLPRRGSRACGRVAAPAMPGRRAHGPRATPPHWGLLLCASGHVGGRRAFVPPVTPPPPPHEGERCWSCRGRRWFF